MKFLQQNHIKYALIMTGVVVLCLAGMEITGQNKSFEKSPFVFFFTMLAPVFVWYFGIRAKKKELKGQLSYKQGVLEGFKIGLTYGIISPFIFLFYYLFINYGIVASIKEVYMMKNASDQTVIHVDILVQFVSSIVFGTLYGAILSLFLKSKKK